MRIVEEILSIKTSYSLRIKSLGQIVSLKMIHWFLTHFNLITIIIHIDGDNKNLNFIIKWCVLVLFCCPFFVLLFILNPFCDDNFVMRRYLREPDFCFSVQPVQIVFVDPPEVVALHQSRKEKVKFRQGQRFAQTIAFSFWKKNSLL